MGLEKLRTGLTYSQMQTLEDSERSEGSCEPDGLLEACPAYYTSSLSNRYLSICTKLSPKVHCMANLTEWEAARAFF